MERSAGLCMSVGAMFVETFEDVQCRLRCTAIPLQSRILPRLKFCFRQCPDWLLLSFVVDPNIQYKTEQSYRCVNGKAILRLLILAKIFFRSCWEGLHRFTSFVENVQPSGSIPKEDRRNYFHNFLLTAKNVSHIDYWAQTTARVCTNSTVRWLSRLKMEEKSFA